MEKTKQAVKRHLKEQWEKACNAYLCELLRMWELDGHKAYWVCNEVGDVLDYGSGLFTIGMEDIIYCVQSDVTREQYMEWQEYICDASEFGFDTPSLKSWMNGCPRATNEAFEKLRKMKANLAEAIEEEKKNRKFQEKNMQAGNTCPSQY